MNWDDLRFVLAVSKVGSLARAAKVLGVEHTTVGRRVTAAEQALGVRLFTRTSAGFVATAEAERLLAPMRSVEDAVLGVERQARAQDDALAGTVRVTSPETLGVSYLAAKLAAFGLAHPGVVVELIPGGAVLDLGRREAEVAVRPFRSTQGDLVARRVADVSYGLYASADYLARRPLKHARELAAHAVLASDAPKDLERRWLARLAPNVKPAFVSPLSSALLEAARASAGVAVLPRYLADAEPSLRRVPMPDAPVEPLWLTVHRDLKQTPRVRSLLDFLIAAMRADAPRFEGR